MPFWKHKRITPAQIILLGFLLLILAGAALLMLPIATRDGAGASLKDALFTAVSATCVTGLVIHDTVQYWTVFGQAIILLLIQIGGMGVVTMAVAIAVFSGKRIGLKQRWTMQESISAPQVGGIVRMTGFILKTALAVEGCGALLLALRFCPKFGAAKGLWYAVFHAVSAFCNAGFDLMGEETPFSSLTAYTGDPLVCGAVGLLIVLGGIGFMTWYDIREHGIHLRRYRLQSKLILSTTAILILGGFLCFLYEFALPQWQGLTHGERIQAALFQSVTPRTAGFNTVDLSVLSQPGKLLTILLMLTGGSPGSTAGGIKTTTLAILLLGVHAALHHWDRPRCFGRRVTEESVRGATAIVIRYLLLFLAGGVLICCIDGVSLMEALFEAASAIGTVGLSLGVTPSLSAPSHMILALLMYFGRVGGLTMLYAVSAGRVPDNAQLPQERVTVG